MKKATNKEVAFFCLPDELLAIVQPIVKKLRADVCVEQSEGGRHYFRKVVLPDDLRALDPQLYVCWLSKFGDQGLTSLVNLVQLWCPVLAKQQLRMGRVALKIKEPGLGDAELELSEKVFREIRKALTTRFAHGVLAKNSRTGGEQFYEDILISDGAVREYDCGVELRGLMGDGFVTFHARPNSQTH